MAKRERKQLPDQELVARLVYELERSAMVWNYFAGVIIDGWLPGPSGLMGNQFKGSDCERLAQLFKIRDHEVRHQLEVLRELGFKRLTVNYSKIYEELSAATEITATEYKPLHGGT